MIFKKVNLRENNPDVWLKAYLYEDMDKKTRPAVLICPGGAYQICYYYEADPIAMNYAAAGYNTFILNYGVNEESLFPKSLIDLCNAIKYIRKNAKEFGVDCNKIALCGFSAGGHLIGSLGTLWSNPYLQKLTDSYNGEIKPNALIFGYSAIGLKTVYSGVADAELHNTNPNNIEKRLTLLNSITSDTPPSFLFHSVRDTVVPVEDSIEFSRRLIDCGVPCELLLFPNGSHGLGMYNKELMAEPDPDISQWMPMSIKWLDRLFEKSEEANEPLKKAEKRNYN